MRHPSIQLYCLLVVGFVVYVKLGIDGVYTMLVFMVAGTLFLSTRRST